MSFFATEHHYLMNTIIMYVKFMLVIDASFSQRVFNGHFLYRDDRISSYRIYSLYLSIISCLYPYHIVFDPDIGTIFPIAGVERKGNLNLMSRDSFLCRVASDFDVKLANFRSGDTQDRTE
uniref:Uncharacterized protein n=1 Tax=Eucampia antarctica TaxID=49252 RepID=A0A7S2W1W6_9STRA